MVFLAWIWPGSQILYNDSMSMQWTHILISLLAYALLSLAAAQSILLLIQENHLRHKRTGLLIRALPPIETMESLMVQMVVVGFLLLSVTVISSTFFSQQVFGRPLTFNHHTLLATLAWIVYATFLFGRWHYGWRGQIAVRWVLGGICLLALGYFGTKFVTEIILHR